LSWLGLRPGDGSHNKNRIKRMKCGPHSLQLTKGTLQNWITKGGRLLAWIGDQVRLKALLSRTQSTTSSVTSFKSKVPQVNPVIRPAHDPEKQGTRAKPSGDLVSRDQTSNRSPDSSRVLSRDKSRDSTRFGWARSPLINKWQTVGTVHNQRRHVTPVIR
jgi:hypothetical protein